MGSNEDIKTLCVRGNWHFYLKEGNREAVYLSFYLSHNDVPAGKNITFEAPVELRIPIDIWREMIVAWDTSDWSADKSLDNTTPIGRALVAEYLRSKKEDDK